eukprot:Ihof_evm6s393 gene=Ihof_evmTU6s393
MATLYSDRIAFQGSLGAYSHLACKREFPSMTLMEKESFSAAMSAVKNGEVKYAMIPIENSQAGRVEEVHQLLKDSKLHIVAEYFSRIEHCLLALKVVNASPSDIQYVYSHPQALAQCKDYIQSHGYKSVAYGDTAGCAKLISEGADSTKAAIASTLAADLYGLNIIQKNIEDAKDNTTRFVLFSTELNITPISQRSCITSIMLWIKKGVVGALGKILGVFGRDNIDIIKLETYTESAVFCPAQ